MVNDAADMVNGRLILRGVVVAGSLSRVPDALERVTLLRRAGTQAALIVLSCETGPGSAAHRQKTLRCVRGTYRGRGNDGPYFFTLLASILMFGSSILVVNAVVTSNGFSMPR